MRIEVRVINLKNYKYVNGFIKSINDITSLESEVNPTGANDTIVQLIDTDINISDNNLIDFLVLLEDYAIDSNELASLFLIGTTNEVKEILDYKYRYQFIESSSKESAFQEYYQNLYNDIPKHLEEYIDWDKLMNNQKLNGLRIESIGPGKHILTTKFIIINKW